MKVTSEFILTTTRSPEENILRALFAGFLNTGVVDQYLLTLEEKLGTEKISGVCMAVWAQGRKPVGAKFLEWIENDSLAKFIVANQAVGTALIQRLKSEEAAAAEPLSVILSQRFRDLTGFDRKRMPKDLKKSFETKVRNAIPKFIEQYNRDPQGIWINEPEMKTPFKKPMSCQDWMELALDTEKNTYIPYRWLRTVHNALQRIAKYEDLTESLQLIRKEFQVALVMLS